MCQNHQGPGRGWGSFWKHPEAYTPPGIRPSRKRGAGQENHRLPTAAQPGLAASRGGENRAAARGVRGRRHAGDPGAAGGSGTLDLAPAPKHSARFPAAGHAGPSARLGDPAGWLAHGGGAALHLAAAGDEAEWPAAGS